MAAHHHHTVTLYNFFTQAEFLFYLSFFRTLFTDPSVKKIVLGVILVYFLIAFVNITFIQGKESFQSHSYVLGCTLIVVSCIYYFYLLFRFPETGDLARNPNFWIVSGLMFYYTCTFSLYGMQNFITEKMTRYYPIIQFAEDLLNILLYTLFSIGFLCQINFRKLLRL